MTIIVVTAVAVVGLIAWFTARKSFTVPCRLDLEATQEHFHAHANLDGVQVEAGDEVLVHNAPSRIALGERRTVETEATVTQVSFPRRIMVRLLGTTQITDLYDVGFEG